LTAAGPSGKITLSGFATRTEDSQTTKPVWFLHLSRLSVSGARLGRRRCKIQAGFLFED
jgi:hypothetical protein